MISEGVSVINHSYTWAFDGPGDGTAPFASSPLNTVDRAVAAGIVWVNAAGNSAERTWFQRGPFSYTTITVDDEDVKVITFEASNFRNRFHLWGLLQLRWDDTWGGAARDLDLYLARPDGGEIALASIDPQSGEDGHYPYERVRSGAIFDIMIAHRSGSEPGWIQLLAYQGGGGSVFTLNTPETGSITNPAESANPGMLTVGAAHWNDANSIRSYSSRGPTPDGRIKPDVVAADCGETAAGSRDFCGTSQASPHVAGMAALVRQRFPGYTPAQVVSYLKENAEQRISSPDPNKTWGHGFIALPPISPQLSGPPTIASVTPGASSLTVTWRASSSDGGSVTTAYDLRHIRSDASSKADSNWTVVHDAWTGSGPLTYVLTALARGTRYDVEVRAVTAAGDGPWSATITGATASTSPGAPTGLTAAANGQTQIDLSWSAPSDTGGSPITGYRIEVSDDGSSWSDLVNNTRSAATRYSHTGLTGGSTRHYRVSAINSAATGPASNVTSAVTAVAPVADLVVDTPTVSESAPAAGARFTLSATVRNQGSGRSDSSTLRYYQSTDSTITTGDSAVGTDSVFGLAASGSGAEWISLSAPSTPGTYYYGACVDAVSDEADTTNNCSSAVAVTVGAAPAPDLVVDPPTVDVSAPVAGASFRLDATVRNQGSGRSDSTTLRYYRSTDSTITTGDSAVGTDSVFGLAASGSGAEWISLTAPSTPGTYYYGACVDAVSDEFDTTNNCSTAVTVTVGAAPAPDLVVDTPTVDVSAPAAGASFTLNATVRNQGSGRSDSTTLRYYQSSDPTITTGDTEIGTDFVSRLDASESGDESISLTAPSTSGTYYYGACVDPVSDESDTTNNCSTAVAVTVGAAPGKPANQRYSWEGTTTVVSWDPSAGADNYKVYYDDFFDKNCSLSSSGTPSFCEELAGNVVGTTYTHTSPDDDRNYYWITACNSAGCSDIDSDNPARLEGLEPAPDLVVDTPTVDASAPAAGERFTLNAAVRNQGNGASDLTTLRYYQSTDSTIATGDTEVGTDSVFRLGASASGDESISLTAPSTPGTYYYGACVSAATDESDTQNNCSVAVTVTVGAAPAPDLVVDTPTVDDNAPTAGVSITLSATVRNQGNGASDSTTLRYYQSTDSTIATGDTEVGTDSVFRLGASASGDESISLTAPSTPGTYYYGACVSAATDESDTQNNCSVAVTVTVGAAPAPDLVVDTPTVDDNAPTAGVSITLSATVRNQGNGASDSTTLRYYQSTDSTITSGDTEVGTDSVFRLGASASGDESISLTAPSTPGTYYYGACVDAISGESDTTNNCSSAVAVVVGAAPAPDLVVDMPTVSASSTIAGATFTLRATVRNQGNGASDSTTLRYYRSTDSTITASDTTVGTNVVAGLAASGSSAESISLTAPSTSGTYYYGACVDAVSDESDTINNCSAAVTVTVGAAPAPDLVVDAPTVSESAPAAGARFALSARVRNQGSGSADSTTLRYYRSTDPTITTGDKEVGTDSVFRLDASGNGAESISLTAPSTPGTYYYGACVDAVSEEFDTTNNCSAAVTVTVGAAPAPDLVVDAPTVDVSAPEAGGRFTLSATVRNQGNGPSAFTTLRYYQSSDPTITTGDTSVGTDSVSRLDASESGDEWISLTAPSTPGTYYYGACVEAVSDESDTTNNCSAAVTVTVAAAPTTGQTCTVNLIVAPGEDCIYPGTSQTFSVDTNGTGRFLLFSSGSLISIRNSSINGVTYTLVARKQNDGKWLVQEVGSTSAVSKPGAPTGLTATADGQTEIDLSWTEPSDDGGASITGYKIEVSTNGSSWSDLVADTGSTGTSYSHTGLTAGSTRHYRVSAINSAGTGPASSADSANTEAAAANKPGAPTGLTATADGQTEIDLSWTEPSDDGGASITGYKIEVSTNGSSWSDLVADTGSTGTSYSHTGLTASSTRHYRVSAINSAGTGPASNVANATTEPDTSQQGGASACADDGAVPDPDNNPGLVADCETLLAARDTLRGTGTLNWSGSTSIANWDAITVGGTPSRVIKLDTSGEGLTLTGTIPAELGNLPALTNLRLSNNELTGTIPAELGNLANLQSLSLWNNDLTGAISSELGNLSNLTFLRLNWNDLTGTIPSELGNLTNLDSLYLGGNRLTGTIPPELGRLTNLRVLGLGGSNRGENQLTGTIPTELSNLTKLVYLGIWNNSLTGTIPAWLGDRTDLSTLILAGNQFTGTIPTELGNLAKVTQLWLHNNQLTGTIPRQLGNLSNVTELHLSNNRLTGEIPAELATLSGLRQLSLANNQLSGCIPAGLRDVAAQHDIGRLGLPDCGSASAPGAPTGLTATADGQTEIDLSWTEPSDDGGASITGYKIEVSTNGSSWSDLVADTGSTGTSYSHTGLTAGTTRHYRVSAINSAGTGDPSNVANATTQSQANSAPKAVGTIPEQVITPGVEITFYVSPYFSDPDGDDLSYSVDSTALFNQLSVSGSAVTMRNDSLLCEPTTVTVTAQDNGGLEATQQFTVRRSNSPPVASSGTFPPQTINVGESSPLYMGNWFSDPDVCDNPLTYMAASSDASRVTASASGNTVTIAGVSAGNATVTVTAQDTGGLEATLDILVWVVATASKPGAPTGLTATADGQTEIDLLWTAPSDNGGASITGYRIEVSTDGSSWSDLVADTGSTTTSYSHTGLTAGTTRHYRASAINSAGTGPASSSDSATTAEEPVSDGTCTVDLIIKPGEGCTYPGTSTEFSVDADGTGRFWFTSSGSSITLRNTKINGVTYTFVASKQSDGNWRVEEVG